jgi:hypothetical protein
MHATAAKIGSNAEMSSAVRAARSALSLGGFDYSNGAYFWDGADIVKNQQKLKRDGIHFSDPLHDIYHIGNHDVPGEGWWLDGHGRKTKLRGRWQYKYESTNAHGGTIFWRLSPDFLKGSGAKEYI